MVSKSESAIEKKEFSRQNYWLRWLKYLLLSALCNGAVWGLSLSYLKKTPPTYTSELLLHVAGSSPGVSVNLPEIGQANTSGATSFGAHSDPRENYKLIASSSAVLTAAAKKLEIPESKFGKPQIDIINNTTLLLVEINGKNPSEAQKKAWAVYNALYARLNVLRTAEQVERDKAVQQALSEAQVKLTEAQKRLSEYKVESGFNSSDQVKDLIGNIGKLETQRIETIAQYQQVSDRLSGLSTTLQLSPQEAANALVLQTDQEFQKTLKEYTNATTTLTTLSPNRGPNYPDVVETKRKKLAALNALLKRGQTLLGIPLEQLSLERLILDNSNGSGVKRTELFVELVKLRSEQQGLGGEITALTQQINNLNEQLKVLSEKESVLANLDRDLQIAQAVFASTLTKIDLSKGDPFGSFPMMQIVEEPNLPTEPTAPKPKLVLAGSVLGSISIVAGLTLIWWREPLAKVTKTLIRQMLA